MCDFVCCRLRDEGKVCALIDELLVYLEGRAMPEEMCRIYLRKIESCYYKVPLPFISYKFVKGFLAITLLLLVFFELKIS